MAASKMDHVLERLSTAIRGLYRVISELGETAVFTEDSIHALDICFQIDAVLHDGLRKKYAGKDECWPLIQATTRTHLVNTLRALEMVRTKRGRVRAWIRVGLNEQSLQHFLVNLVHSKSDVDKYYEPDAMINMSEQLDVIITLLAGLENLHFNLPINIKELDPLGAGREIRAVATPASALDPAAKPSVSPKCSPQLPRRRDLESRVRVETRSSNASTTATESAPGRVVVAPPPSSTLFHSMQEMDTVKVHERKERKKKKKSRTKSKKQRQKQSIVSESKPGEPDSDSDDEQHMQSPQLQLAELESTPEAEANGSEGMATQSPSQDVSPRHLKRHNTDTIKAPAAKHVVEHHDHREHHHHHDRTHPAKSQNPSQGSLQTVSTEQARGLSSQQQPQTQTMAKLQSKPVHQAQQAFPQESQSPTQIQPQTSTQATLQASADQAPAHSIAVVPEKTHVDPASTTMKPEQVTLVQSIPHHKHKSPWRDEKETPSQPLPKPAAKGDTTPIVLPSASDAQVSFKSETGSGSSDTAVKGLLSGEKTQPEETAVKSEGGSTAIIGVERPKPRSKQPERDVFESERLDGKEDSTSIMGLNASGVSYDAMLAREMEAVNEASSLPLSFQEEEPSVTEPSKEPTVNPGNVADVHESVDARIMTALRTGILHSDEEVIHKLIRASYFEGAVELPVILTVTSQACYVLIYDPRIQYFSAFASFRLHTIATVEIARNAQGIIFYISPKDGEVVLRGAKRSVQEQLEITIGDQAVTECVIDHLIRSFERATAHALTVRRIDIHRKSNLYAYFDHVAEEGTGTDVQDATHYVPCYSSLPRAQAIHTVNREVHIMGELQWHKDSFLSKSWKPIRCKHQGTYFIVDCKDKASQNVINLEKPGTFVRTLTPDELEAEATLNGETDFTVGGPKDAFILRCKSAVERVVWLLCCDNNKQYRPNLIESEALIPSAGRDMLWVSVSALLTSENQLHITRESHQHEFKQLFCVDIFAVESVERSGNWMWLCLKLDGDALLGESEMYPDNEVELLFKTCAAGERFFKSLNEIWEEGFSQPLPTTVVAK
eukprot:m.74770 g.74770  ORF g.74770 m.74770 type:complete len:1063 (-) comp12410_c0_seq1:418-3606(-)